MPLSTANRCPERRSNDGQMIFEDLPAPETGADLLFRGAPLRNRTVDLLLTMDRSADVQPQVEQLTCRNTSGDRHAQALGEPSQAPFATQSATQIDLAVPSGPDP